LSVTACPKCGSRKIFQGRLKEGVLTGYTNRYVCRDCGYQGSPLIFDSNDEYYKFQMRKKSDKPIDKNSTDQILDEDYKLSDKDKEVVNFLKELDNNSSPVIETKSTTLKIFISLSIVLIFSLIITLYYTPVYFYFPAILVVIALEIIFYIIYHNKVN
jgi:DNA-directed RNA polymerase subunit RPC12/RpoP